MASKETARCPPTPTSPADSGYGSGSELPRPKSRRAPKKYRSFADLSKYREKRFGEYGQCDGPSDGSTDMFRSMTLPRRFMSRSQLHSLSTPTRPSLRTSNTDPGILPTRSSKSLDRFVAKRRPTLQLSVESFHSSIEPSRMTPNEKLLRNNGESPDPFVHRRRATSPSPFAQRYSVRQNDARVRSGSATALTFQRDPCASNDYRQISVGTVWTVGGIAPSSAGVSNGRGGMLGRGTNAPFYVSDFSDARTKAQHIQEVHEGRLATALDLDRMQRIFEYRQPSNLNNATLSVKKRRHSDINQKTIWKDGEWKMPEQDPKTTLPTEDRVLPSAPFKVLDAPQLRDDFYCSVLAYSATCHTMAVGLGQVLYRWSEQHGVHVLSPGKNDGSWLTSLAFSSTQGQKCILAFGRSDGSINLLSIYDGALERNELILPRFEVRQPCPVACVTWKPTVNTRRSKNPSSSGIVVQTEILVVGDEIGNVYIYSVEWPDKWEVSRDGWPGSMTLSARISVHTQQICGLAFSPDGCMFATGGNDNVCALFQTTKVVDGTRDETPVVVTDIDGVRFIRPVVDQIGVRTISYGSEKHRWMHNAAVKAIAFCPWRPGLLATGGGSNDKCIHFYHTASGATLATISVAAQVTSLIWSTTRREIAATFGYAQPDHPYRIAVFSWPECKRVAAIRWENADRALYAIPYPGGPNEIRSGGSREGSIGSTRTSREGCIVVASSDESVKFHEVWAAGQKATAGGQGLLGGSDIIEESEGIDREVEVIR
ncbi:WD40 repeat-like protein [Coleophoma crateriformis]|uniref:WD40 repeat-like protein n=1 Tax=Coleophoma crateriformis TaxID=565419 RepID=A0A3D8RP56_9HELO|nr:WD40 repeat-like protein [Coleophoma crateriformis]